MEIKEIRHVVMQMQKLHKDGNYEDVSCLLTDLQNADVTLEQLQTTEAAKIVYQLIKSCTVPEIQKRAKGLLSKWKRLYSLSNEQNNVSTKQTSDNISADKAEIVPTTTQHIDQLLNYNENINTVQGDPTDPTSEGATSKEGRCSPELKGPETVSLKEDSQTSLKTHPQSDSILRAKCVELLHQALKQYQKTDPEHTDRLLNLAQTIEIHIHSLHCQNTPKYKSCIRSKIANIKNPKSPHLRQGLLSGTLAPHTFAQMSTEEMASEELRRLRQDYMVASISQHQLPQAEEGTPTTKVRCQRCEGTDCRVTQVSRGTLYLPSWVKRSSADEDAMTFMTCVMCGAQWYHNNWVCL